MAGDFRFVDFGDAEKFGTSHVSIGTGTVGDILFGTLHLTNVAAATDVRVKAWVAANSWASGEPTGASLIYALTDGDGLVLSKDGGLAQIPNVVVNGNQKVVVWCDTASGADAKLAGVAET